MPDVISAESLNNVGPGMFERLLGLKESKENERAFCLRIGVSVSTWRVWELKYQAQKNFAISFKVLADIVKATGKSPIWLLWGVNSSDDGNSTETTLPENGGAAALEYQRRRDDNGSRKI